MTISIYAEQTNIFKQYKEHISKIKLNKNNPKSNFAKHVIENKHTYITSIIYNSKKMKIYDKIKNNSFNNIVNVQIGFKNNIVTSF